MVLRHPRSPRPHTPFPYPTLFRSSRARRPGIATAAVLLLAGRAISLWQFMRAHDALEQARRQTAIADATNRFLNDDLLGAGIGGDSPAWYERNPSLREILDARSAESRGGKGGVRPWRFRW